MPLTAVPVSLAEITRWRDLYREEMNCQVVHDSLHPRDGWTEEYLLASSGAPAGYGSIVVGGPWKGTRTLFEFYLLPEQRLRAFAFFECLREASRADGILVQTNDALLTVMFHAYARNVATEKIVFAEGITTHLTANGVTLRHRGEPDNDWALEVDGTMAAWGGVLYHYNRPYGDVYMEVAEAFRRRGLGAYLVQELKRICNEQGSIPCARCNPDNIASRNTLQKAGFVLCAHLLTGSL